MRPAPVDIHDLAAQVVDEARTAHPERELRLVRKGAGHGSWDAGRVAQVLSLVLLASYAPYLDPSKRSDSDRQRNVRFALFAAVLLSGLRLACLGSRAGSVVAVAAWTALGVHSVIDHLYEFPSVVLSAGAVLGWAGATGGRGTAVRRAAAPAG